MPQKTPLALLLLTFLALGALFAVFTPDWQAPDEPAHYNYIRQLSAGRLPVLESGDYDQEFLNRIVSSQFDPSYSIASLEYEDHQPPLYYLLLTPVFRLTGGSLLALRLTSLLMGAGVILLATLIASRLFPGRMWLAFTAAAFVAFLPQHVAMLSAVNNDTLAELIVAGLLLMVLRMADNRSERLLRNGREQGPRSGSNRRLVALGVLLGLGLITKATVYIMMPVVAGVILWIYWADGRGLGRALLTVFGVASLIGLSWWLRNALLYGGLDILGTAAHDRVVIGQPRTAEWLADRGLANTLRAFMQTTFQSFWGQFGWMGVVMPGWVYALLLGFTSVTAVGLLSAVAQAVGNREQRVDSLKTGNQLNFAPLILAGTFLLSLSLYLAYNVTFVQHQGRYLFPALVPIAIGVAYGWSIILVPLMGRSSSRLALFPIGLALALVALDLLALFRFIVPSLT